MKYIIFIILLFTSAPPAQAKWNEHDAIEDSLVCIIDSLSVANDNLRTLIIAVGHISYLFPEESDETVILISGATDNVYGGYAEIIDNDSDTLSNKFTSPGHISSIMIEDASVNDKIYVLEISHGDTTAATMVSQTRYMSGSNKIGTTQQARLRMPHVLPGDRIWYRMKCETASATLQAHFRYHLH